MAFKKATFIAPKSAPKTTRKTNYFMLVLKNLTKNSEKKADDQICFDEIDQFYNYFFLHALSYFIGENSPAMHGWRKFVFMKPLLYFFPQTLQIICIC